MQVVTATTITARKTQPNAQSDGPTHDQRSGPSQYTQRKPMTMYPQPTRTDGLPDPDLHAEFYADVPLKRFLAFIVDAVLIVLITVVLIPLTAFTALFYLGFLGLMVSFIYRSWSLASRSATPGMRLMAIEFRTHDGDRFDLGTALIHTLFFSISMSMVVPQVISIILMLVSGRRQGLTDHFLGTTAINRAALH